jgi:hypothetical protein
MGRIPRAWNIHFSRYAIIFRVLQANFGLNLIFCQGFKYGGDPWSGWFRLSFPLRGDYLDVALERFERLLDARSEHDYCRI